MSLDDVIGEKQLGDYARWQFNASRNDPRLSRSVSVPGDDFRHAIEEAHRSLMLSRLGLIELTGAFEREKAKLPKDADPGSLTLKDKSRLQGYWERSEMARIELENETPHAHGTALISLLSALDALVEGLPLALENILTDLSAKRYFDEMPEDVKSEWTELDPEAKTAIESELERLLRDHYRVPRVRLEMSGVERYESLLTKIGLPQSEDFKLPQGLDDTLKEAHSLRNVLVHRGGRIDERALKAAPSLALEVGDFVRVGRDELRTYSAAISTVGDLVLDRLFGPLAPKRSLENWRDNYQIGT